MEKNIPQAAANHNPRIAANNSSQIAAHFLRRSVFALIGKFTLFVAISLLFVVIHGLPAEAAMLYFSPVQTKVGIGEEFEVDIFLNVDNESINALEGIVVFPHDLLELLSIHDGDSIINFWLERPAVLRGTIQNNPEIIFSGIIPGGFEGVLEPFKTERRDGKIFTLLFKAKKKGTGSVVMRDVQTLLNDGKGTPTVVSLVPFAFNILGYISKKKIERERDNTPPEVFEIQITRDDSIFNGKYFVVFGTQDKESGISHYEVAERRGREIQDYDKLDWVIAESPYILEDQLLRSYVYVKAIDNDGNALVAIASPLKPSLVEKNYLIWIIIIIGVFVYIVVRFLWKKKTPY